MLDKSIERQIALQGAYNFRDLGGYETNDGRHVRWRRLFRSDELHHLTEADLVYTRDVLGIKSVIDLREAKVIEQGVVTSLGKPPARYRNIPTSITPNRVHADGNLSRSLADGYLLCLAYPDVQHSIVEALKAIAEASSEPTVFHCSLGKDRTGLISAFLLSILGVSEADIIADYALSEEPASKVVDRACKDPNVALRVSRIPSQIFHALPETMEQVLAALNSQFGSIRNFILYHGGDEKLFCQLEEALLVQDIPISQS